MSVAAIALISVSVVLHALWNTVAKGRPTFALFFISNLIGATALLPVAIAHASVLPDLPPTIWLILGCTGIAQAVYGLTLMRAYRVEDLSVVYPLVRSLGPVFVIFGSFVLGRGDAIGIACVLGIAAILFGSFTLVFSNMRALGKSRLPSAGIRLCVYSALGTMAYTLLDDEGVRRVLDSGALNALGSAPVRSGLLYASFEAWASCLAMGSWLLTNREHRADLLASGTRPALRDAAIVGLGSYVSYTLVLISMLYADDVSYVAGFRQLSVPLGAAIGILWLGEYLDRTKALGLLAMLIGLLTVAFV